MNKRIQELILEAGFPKFDKMYVVSDGEELEKFATLIIEECAALFYLTHTDEQYQRRIDKTIRKHFGVES
jgi:hypothetical protein